MELGDYCTGIQHIGIPTDDMDKTVSFYQSIGFREALGTVNEKEHARVEFLQNGNLMLETYESKNVSRKTGAIDHFCIDVKDMKKVYEYLKSHGFQMLETEIQFLPFWEHGVQFINILGPNGEKIEFSQKL